MSTRVEYMFPDLWNLNQPFSLNAGVLKFLSGHTHRKYDTRTKVVNGGITSVWLGPMCLQVHVLKSCRLQVAGCMMECMMVCIWWRAYDDMWRAWRIQWCGVYTCFGVSSVSFEILACYLMTCDVKNKKIIDFQVLWFIIHKSEISFKSYLKIFLLPSLNHAHYQYTLAS